MKRTSGLILCLFLASTVLGATAAVRERTWQPLVRLAAGSGPEAKKLAAGRLKDGAATLGTVLNGLDADEPTRAFFSKVMEQLESFDLESLYETLPEQEPNGVKAVGFTGHSEGAKYQIKQVPVAATSTDPASGLGSRFGDLAVGFRSRKAEGSNDNFVGNVKASVGLGNASWFQVVSFFAENLKLIESTGPGTKADPVARPSKTTLEEVKKDNPKLGPEDLELMGLFRESFPRLYDHLRELYRTDDVLVYDPDADNYQQLHLVFSVRRDSEKHRPVVEWFEAMGPLMNGRGDLCDSRGRTLLTIRFNTKDLALTIDGFVAGGKLCPVESGKVLVEESVDLEAVATADRRDRWSFESDVNGICTEVKDLAFKVHYENGVKGMNAVIVCDEEPKVRVHGSAFGVLPTWAIDVVIPGNMEELTRSFFHVVTRGNGGKGMVIRADTRISANSGVSVFDLDGEAEGLNNFLVRLGFKLARKKLIPPDDAIDDLAHYLRDGHAALTKDIEEFATGVK